MTGDTWVTALRGAIGSYQVWSEGNISRYWSGTQQQLADLTEKSNAAVKGCSGSVQVVAASTGKDRCHRARLDPVPHRRHRIGSRRSFLTPTITSTIANASANAPPLKISPQGREFSCPGGRSMPTPVAIANRATTPAWSLAMQMRVPHDHIPAPSGQPSPTK